MYARRVSATHAMKITVNTSATTNAAKCAAAVNPNAIVSSTIRGRHFLLRSLQRMRNPNCGVNHRKNAQRCQNLVVGVRRRPHHRRRRAIQRQRNVTALVTEQPPRHPPQARPQRQPRQNEGQPQHQLDRAHLVPHLPRRGRRCLSENDTFQRQWQPRRSIRQRPVVNIPAGGEVARQRRGPLPHLPPAARKLIIRLRKRLPRAHPQALPQQKQQHHRRDLLRSLESKFPQLVVVPPDPIELSAVYRSPPVRHPIAVLLE